MSLNLYQPFIVKSSNAYFVEFPKWLSSLPLPLPLCRFLSGLWEERKSHKLLGPPISHHWHGSITLWRGSLATYTPPPPPPPALPFAGTFCFVYICRRWSLIGRTRRFRAESLAGGSLRGSPICCSCCSQYHTMEPSEPLASRPAHSSFVRRRCQFVRLCRARYRYTNIIHIYKRLVPIYIYIAYRTYRSSSNIKRVSSLIVENKEGIRECASISAWHMVLFLPIQRGICARKKQIHCVTRF